MSILNNSLLLGADAGAAGYQISRSLRFNSADSAYLSRTPASAGNRRTFTVSFWIKKCRNSLSTSQYLLAAGTGTSESTWFAVTFDIGTSTYDELSTGTWTSAGGSTNASLRDSSAWYHIVVSVDTTQATASNRVKTYVNNVLQSTTTVTISQNADLAWNNNVVHYIGARADSGPRNFFDGYIADFHNIDGQALTPSSFAETNATTGQWVPKAYTGTYGTNGFRLDFSDNSAATATTLGKDRAGSNNWTPNNLSVTAGAGNDSLVDTPTSYGTDTGAGGEVRGNYATLNPLNLGASATLANGNLDHASTTGSWTTALSTIGMQSGKWYFEATMTSTGEQMVGIANSAFTTSTYLGANTNSWAYYSSGVKYTNASASSYGASYTNGDVIGVALDIDAGTITFYKNGATQGQAFSGLTGPLFFGVSGISSTTRVVNFGQRPFVYTAPSGFKALCDTNLPAPVVAKPSTVMDVALYAGTGSSLTATSALGFSPDLVWIKGRSGATDHALYDAVRGATLDLVSNSTAAETTQTQGLTAFNSNGFSVGTLAKVNTSSATYAAWTWDAGSSTVTNTSGSISSQVRANASAGFSIVTYTGNGTVGATVGHGLGVAPAMLIVKRRDAASGARWAVQHTSLAATQLLALNTTAAAHTESAGAGSTFNVTKAGSSVFTLGDYQDSNANTGTYVAYCFAPVAGYSAFGSYTGNGTSDGPFVYTGFRSRWVIFKSTTAATGWFIWDSATNTYNVATKYLTANAADAEGTYTGLDILSNGLKARSSSAFDGFNQSGQTYVYAAFAENPFQYARAR